MPRSLRWTALLLTLCLVAAACGDDDDDETSTAAGPEATSEADGGDGGDGGGEAGEVSMDEPLEVAPGTELPLPDCPSDWSNTAGITEDTILLGMSLPESGPVAALGEVDDGARAWFDDVNENDPIDGKQIELVSRTTPTTRRGRWRT
jgi:ABC-type branched-subunit amino acid transport system substrate-binding protein